MRWVEPHENSSPTPRRTEIMFVGSLQRVLEYQWQGNDKAAVRDGVLVPLFEDIMDEFVLCTPAIKDAVANVAMVEGVSYEVKAAEVGMIVAATLKIFCNQFANDCFFLFTEQPAVGAIWVVPNQAGGFTLVDGKETA